MVSGYTMVINTPIANTVIGCQINYHHNYQVQGGIRKYYAAIPDVIQAAEHQFIDTRLGDTWLNLMLVAWYVSKISSTFKFFLFTFIFLGHLQPTVLGFTILNFHRLPHPKLSQMNLAELSAHLF